MCDKSIQTDFPVTMLEDYVIKNRRRILKLLGINQAAGTGEDIEIKIKYVETYCIVNKLLIRVKDCTGLTCQ